MTITPTYPGVYVEELPSGVRPVVGVATSITAFVGYAPVGPEHRARRVDSFGDYERLFGGIDSESVMSYAVQQFFRNGGSTALVVRVPKSDAVAASMALEDDTGAVALTLTASSTGAWGNNLAVDVDHDGLTAGDAFNLSITDLSTGVSERFANLSVLASSPRRATVVLNDEDTGSALVRATAGTSTNRPVATGTSGADVTLPLTVTAANTYQLTVQPDIPTEPDPGNPGSTIPSIGPVTVTVFAPGERVPTSTAGVASHLARKINLALAADDDTAGLVVRCVPTDTGAGVRILSDLPAGGGPSPAWVVDSVTPAGTTDDAATLLGLDTATTNVGRYEPGGVARLGLSAATAGANGTTLPDAARLTGSEATFRGMYALLRTDLFNLLCIPDASRPDVGNPAVLDPGLGDPTTLLADAYALCERRRAMLLVDPPPGVVTPDEAVDWIDDLGARGPNSVAHYPRLRIPDVADDFRPRTVAPSGTMAGLYARTDATRGVWKAPAGIEARLRGLTGTEYTLTDAENGILNPLGLNCTRTFPVIGAVNWGGRTTDGADVLASQWRYTPVRRLALFIEESLYRGTQWAVFEPNDEPLWAQLRLNLTAFMQDLFRKGAFAGATPAEAYLVKCDRETTTQDDVNRGVVNVLVGFAPLRPAEFVIVRIQQLAGQPA